MGKPPVSRLPDGYQTYPTADAAAAAALRGITEKQYERGGGILYNKEQNVYAATSPVGQSDGSHFAAAVGMPKGWELHATYHTHPSGDRSTQFSEDDINTAQQLKVPSYILPFDDNKVHMFDPSSSKVLKDTTAASGRFPVKYSLGSVVDETPPETPPSVASADPAPTTSPAPTSTTQVSGSRIMSRFAASHRAQTTKYRHRVVLIKKGAPKRP